MFFRFFITLILLYLGQNVLSAQDIITLSDAERAELSDRYYQKMTELEYHLNVLASPRKPDQIKESIIASIQSMFINNGNNYVDFGGVNSQARVYVKGSLTRPSRSCNLQAYLMRLKNLFSVQSINVSVPEKILFYDIYRVEDNFYIESVICEREEMGTYSDYTERIKMIPIEQLKYITPDGPEYTWKVQIDEITVIENY